MSVSPKDVAWAQDVFAPLGKITTRTMMGGLSIYCDGQIFAMLDSAGTPYLKARDAFAACLAQAGARQFGADSGKTMGYWTLPETALNDPDRACNWAKQTLAALK